MERYEKYRIYGVVPEFSLFDKALGERAGNKCFICKSQLFTGETAHLLFIKDHGKRLSCDRCIGKIMSVAVSIFNNGGIAD